MNLRSLAGIWEGRVVVCRDVCVVMKKNEADTVSGCFDLLMIDQILQQILERKVF
jgi:hypothetical protein